MSDTKIEVGSVVVLMSGGPGMTVICIHKKWPPGTDDPTIYHCVWFDAGKIGEGRFPEGTIKFDPRHKTYGGIDAS